MSTLSGRIVGLILAGGASSRMGGGNKTLLDVNGQPIICHVIDRLSGQVDKVVINANSHLSEIHTYGYPVVSDSFPERLGPLAGIHSGLKWAKHNDYPWVATVAGDTPFFPLDIVEELSNSLNKKGGCISIAATRAQGRLWPHPTFGIWSVDLLDDLENALDSNIRKVLDWANQHNPHIVEISTHVNDPFLNINTPNDLAFANRVSEKYL